MSVRKIIPGLEDDLTDAPPKLEIASSLANAVTFTKTVTPKPIQPSKSQMFARMATCRAEMLAKKNRLAAEIKAPSKKISTAEWIAYRIDQYISTRRGQTMSLTVLGLMLMTAGGLLLKVVRPSTALKETVWESWTFLADPGSHTSLVSEGLRIVGVIMTLTGILYFSVIMGFVVDGIRAKMDMLKKGKTNVAEQNHTLLLGWSDKSISLIRQICLANASNKGGVIVVLAETEKEELEAELESQMRPGELLGTRIIFRTGTPLLSVDLLKVSAHRARSIIIMATLSGEADRSDAAILRTVLSLKTLPELSGHIVAELRDIDNDPLLRLVGGNDVEILVSHDVIGRLVLMSARSPGLARVYSALLGFEGNEFYFKAWPECVGVLFSGLAERFPDATPVGIKRKNGGVFICPESDMAVEEGDEILVLAEDDDTYKACPPVQIEVGRVPVPPIKFSSQERILMCGWRRDIRDMIQLLDAIVRPGTELHIICEEPIPLRNKSLLESGLDINALKNIRLLHHLGNTAIRRQLEKLPWRSFTSIMILSDQSREMDIMHSDSHSLASLLLIRDLQTRTLKAISGSDSKPDFCKCISEILDPRTQRTISTSATILRLSEFIQSNELVSCILAMISESRDVRVILDELLGPQGAYFEVEPSTRYCEVNEKVSFWQLAKRAMTRGDILCGYQVRDGEETILNPERKDQARSWGNFDMIVIRNANATAQRSSLTTVDFERTTKSRRIKNTFSRKRLLSAIIQDVDRGRMGPTSDNPERSSVMRALSSFAEDDDSNHDGHYSSFSLAHNRDASVHSLIAAARMLADELEQTERTQSTSNEEVEEDVSEFDVHNF